MFAFHMGLKKSSRPLLSPNHQALFLRIAQGGAKRVEMTQHHQVTLFWSRKPPDSYLHQFSSQYSTFMCDLKKSSRPLLIPNHKAFFLRNAHCGDKRVKMTKNHPSYTLLEQKTPDCYLHQVSSLCSPFM